VKRRSGLGVALGVLAAIALAGPTLAAFTGPTNGGFESGTYVDNGSGFEQLNTGDTSITGWTVGGNSIDWVGSYWPAPEGAMSIDLSGSDAGSLSQAFDTTIGNTYTVSFLLSGNPAGGPAVKTLDVSATGGTTTGYTHDTTGTDLGTMVWTPETYEFVATSASTTLTFNSTTASAFGPALDNVVVTETAPPAPPPATAPDCKDGGWQTMTDTAGNSFKNQGDCVSFFATKGKNLGAIAPAAAADVSAATDTDATDSVLTHSNKAHDKVTGRHSTERQDAKDKAKNTTKSHGGHGHGSGSHHSK
jgi:choice-of-anchor C domain-containing protein